MFIQDKAETKEEEEKIMKNWIILMCSAFGERISFVVSTTAFPISLLLLVVRGFTHSDEIQNKHIKVYECHFSFLFLSLFVSHRMQLNPQHTQQAHIQLKISKSETNSHRRIYQNISIN